MTPAPERQDKIARAEQKKRDAAELISKAFSALTEAQNLIGGVEGNGFADVYEDLADTYQQVSRLRTKLLAMNPTGLSE